MSHRLRPLRLSSCAAQLPPSRLRVSPSSPQSGQAQPPAGPAAGTSRPPRAGASRRPRPRPSAKDPVVATVNGQPIRLSELEVAQQALPQQYRNMPLQAVFPALLDRIIDSKLVVPGRQEEQGQRAIPPSRSAWPSSRTRCCRTSGSSARSPARSRAEKLQQRYQERLKSMPAEEEVHARHILVATEDEAKAMHRRAQEGHRLRQARQGEVDRQGVGRRRRRSRLVQEVRHGEGVRRRRLRLKKGELTETPVKTQFGYHVIKVEDRRKAPPPAFEEMADQLREEMAREAVTAQLDQLRSGAKIEKFDMDGSKPDAARRPSRLRRPRRQPPARRRPLPGSARKRQVKLTFLCVSGVGSAVRSDRVRPGQPQGEIRWPSKHALSPLAPKTTPTLPRIAGVKLAAAQSGVRYKDRDDVMLAVVPAGATIAGVLTRSKTSSAPVDWCRKNLAARQGARHRRQCRQRQRLHRQAGRQGGRGEHPRRSPRRWAARATRCSWPRPA